MDKLPDVHNDGIRVFCKNRERIQMNRRRIVFLLHTRGIFISWFSLTKKSKMIKSKDGEMQHKRLFFPYGTRNTHIIQHLCYFFKFTFKKTHY